MKRLLALFLLLSTLTHAAYLGSWAVDDYITITATTHRASSGAAYAATAITLRIYKDDTATEIVEDAAMTAFDSVTGLYASKIQLTAAAGFDAGKCYTVLIQATVDSVTAITTHTFQVLAKTTATNMVAAAPSVGDIRTELATELGRIDAAISTRSTYAGGAVASVTGNVGGNVAGSVASVTAPVTVGTNSDKTGYSLTTAPPTAEAIRQEIDTNSTQLAAIVADTGELQTNQGNWLTATGFSTLTAEQVWGYGTKALTDKAGFTLHADYDAAKAAAPTVVDIANAMLMAVPSRLAVSGTTPNVDGNYDLVKVFDGDGNPNIGGGPVWMNADNGWYLFRYIEEGLPRILLSQYLTDYVTPSEAYWYQQAWFPAALTAMGTAEDNAVVTVDTTVGGGATAQQVWEHTPRTLTQTVGDATAANQTTIQEALTLLERIAKGDTYIDTTVTPWQMVVHKAGDPTTEYLRKNLLDINGDPITSINTVIAQQEEPE